MKLMVIDGNSLVSRAFYGMHQNLTTVEGQPTGAIYGFLTMLHRYLKDIKPEALCVTFDMKAPTFRHKQYEEYKAGRKPMPEELASQLPLLREVLEALQIPYYQIEGWEADDLLGTIARIDEEQGVETVVVTGDRDSLQLVTEKTSVLYLGTKKNILYTPSVFEEEYGFPAKNIVDLKALMGDTSDNIPGIKGLGVKTVTPLIGSYHTIEAIYEKLQAPEETLGLGKSAINKLRGGEEDARLSYELATIMKNAPLNFVPEKQKIVPPDHTALYDILSSLELHKMIEYYNLTPSVEEVASTLGAYTVESVTTQARWKELQEEWQGQRLTVLALPEVAGVAVYVEPSGEKEEGCCALLLEREVEDYGSFLEGLFQGDYTLQVHESKALRHALLAEGIQPTNITFDVEVAAYLIAPDDKEYSIETLCKRYLKFSPNPSEHYTDCESFSALSDPSVALGTWSNHVVILSALGTLFQEKLEEQELLWVYEHIELPLCGVLAKMEREGVCVDRSLLQGYEVRLGQRVEELQQLIQEEAGEAFNVSSPSQLGKILFEKMELPAVKKTKTGYSTNIEVLEQLKQEHPNLPILGYVIEHRHVSKLHSTYAKGLLKVVTSQGKIHTTFKNTVTGTGRLSSTDPNLQNIPIRTPLGEELRYMFVAQEGNVLIDADYSQIELRLLAELSGDENMISAFLSGEDFHSLTASQVFHVPVGEVDSTMRRAAKAVNFGIVYGMSAFSLSQDIGVTVYEAKEYITRYFKTYPQVEAFMTEVVAEAKAKGYVKTAYGRRRAVPELNSSNGIKRNAAERVAQNMPMQGTAADIMKLAMIAVEELLLAYPKAKLVLQIHDEIIVECGEEEKDELCEKIRQVMEGVADFRVPLLAETNWGKSWGDSH